MHKVGSIRQRTASFAYFMREKRVCKDFFVRTLGIRKKKNVQVVLEKRIGEHVTPDRRGKQGNKKQIANYLRGLIKAHIESYPVMLPHCIRKSSQRRYLPCDLNISKLHFQYTEMHKENTAAVSSPCIILQYLLR